MNLIANLLPMIVIILFGGKTEQDIKNSKIKYLKNEGTGRVMGIWCIMYHFNCFSLYSYKAISPCNKLKPSHMKKIILSIVLTLYACAIFSQKEKRHELPYDIDKNKVAWVGDISYDKGISRKEASINLIQWGYKNSFKAETDNTEAGIVVLSASLQYTNGDEDLHKAPFRIYFIVGETTISYRITDMTVARYPIEVRYEYGKKRPAMGYHYAFIDIDEKINKMITDFTRINQK